METIKMGKRGTVVIPAKMRKEFGLTDGSLLITEIKQGEISLRPATPYTGEIWTPERTAYFMLINSMTKEEWDDMVPDVIAMGLDPQKIDGIEPNHRDTLLTNQQWDERARKAVEAGRAERPSA